MQTVRMLSGWASRGRVLEAGDVLELPADVARAWVADGLAEPVAGAEPASSAAPAEAAMRAPAETAVSLPRRARGR